jgi:predicted PurR-regulated permease PerM
MKKHLWRLLLGATTCTLVLFTVTLFIWIVNYFGDYSLEVVCGLILSYGVGIIASELLDDYLRKRAFNRSL